MHDFLFLSDVNLMEDGYRISFPQSEKDVKDFLIPVGTIEFEIFHSYLSVILQEFNFEPGEWLWRKGMLASEYKASHFLNSPLNRKRTSAIPRYIAGKLGYDAKTKMRFKTNSFEFKDILLKEKENDEVTNDADNYLDLVSGDVPIHESLRPFVDFLPENDEQTSDLNVDVDDSAEKDLSSANFTNEIASDTIDTDYEDNVDENISDSDSEFGDSEAKKSSNAALDLAEWIKDLDPIVCLGLDPYNLESASMVKDLPDVTRRKYIKTWCDFLNSCDIRLGHPPTYDQVFGFIEKMYLEGKMPATLKAYFSHISMGLQQIYNRKLANSQKILG